MFQFTKQFLQLSLAIIALFLINSCSELPRDPENTLRRIKNDKKLRVGLVENPPWVIHSESGEPAGAEVELIKNFALQLGAQPEWHWGGEQPQFEALERFQLDLVAGGFNDKTPWSKQIGLTSPYFENRIMVGFPASMTITDEIKGRQIEAKEGESTAAFLEKKDALPVRVRGFSQDKQIPIAASEWELEQLGLNVSKIELNRENHLIAVPPGENALVKRLDELLSSQKQNIKGLLQQQAEIGRK